MISKIHLTNFRNFRNKTFLFSPQTTVIVGPNAVGKTNILESMFLISTGKSFKASLQEEMINYKSEIARAKAKIEKDILEVVLTRGEITVGDDPSKVQKAPRKRLLVNEIGRRMIDFAGNFKTVFFGPENMDLVTESPSVRRNFLDTVLSQVDREYRRAILSYEKGLRQRNKLLFRIREEGLARSQLIFWNQLLIKNGDYILTKREELIDFVGKSGNMNGQKFSLEYDKSVISEARLARYAREEIAAATTLVGPHRDDFVFKLSKYDLANFGSRGEQRMGVLWLKLAELAFIEEKTGEKPTLLLDDIFSELDHSHREVVMALSRNQQTVITTADPHFIKGLKGLKILKL